MKIIFVRHAQSVDDKLTRFGIKQAKYLVKDLAYENIAKVYCSPMNRTMQTAAIIAKKLHLSQPVADNRIRERELDKSRLSGEELAEFDANYLNPNFSHTNPEGCKEFVQRVFDFLTQIIADNNLRLDDSLLIVGHSSLAYVMYAYFYGLPKDKNLVWVRAGNASKLCFEYRGRQ